MAADTRVSSAHFKESKQKDKEERDKEQLSPEDRSREPNELPILVPLARVLFVGHDHLGDEIQKPWEMSYLSW